MTGVTRRDFLTATGALVAGTALARASDAVAAPSRAAWTLPAKRPFRVIENDWIPLKDGTRLAVRLWIPEGAEQRPVPVVWEYLPYRKRDDATARNLALRDRLCAHRRSRILEGQPNGAVWTQENMTAWKRDDWNCTVSAASELTSTAEEFRLTEVLRDKKGDQEIFKREQFSSIRRDLL